MITVRKTPKHQITMLTHRTCMACDSQTGLSNQSLLFYNKTTLFSTCDMIFFICTKKNPTILVGMLVYRHICIIVHKIVRKSECFIHIIFVIIQTIHIFIRFCAGVFWFVWYGWFWYTRDIVTRQFIKGL